MTEYIDREAFLKDAEIRYCLPCKGAGKDYNGVKCRACWVNDMMGEVDDAPAADVAPVVHWIPVTEQLPESNHKNDHVGDVLCFVPPRDGCYQSGLYLGKPKHVEADDGIGNFWGLPIQESDWTLWGWSYLEKPVVTHWMPLPEPPKMDGDAENGKTDV